MRVVLASPAAQDLLKAIDFYNDLAPGLGTELLDEFEAGLGQITEFPEAGSPYLKNTRRTLLRRFPFSIVYRVRADTLEVVALAHRSRRPGYWTERS